MPGLDSTQPKRSRHFIGLGTILLLCVAAMILISPWTLHMGGRPTPSLIWHGYGKMATAHGVDSTFFLELNALSRGTQRAAKRAGWTRSDNIGGTAVLCINGDRIPFDVWGSVDAWLDADGRPMILHLTAPKDSPTRYSATLYGGWHGGDLGLTDRGTLAPLLARGKLKSSGGSSATIPENRSVILQYAKPSEFEAACRAQPGSAF